MSNSTLNMVAQAADISIILIILSLALVGYFKGFASSVFSFLRWFFCSICAIIFAVPAKNLIIKYTALDAHFAKNIKEAMDSALASNDFIITLPRQIRLVWDDIRNASISEVSKTVSSTLIAVLSFVILFIALSVISRILLHSIENKKHGVLGFSNRLCGMGFGALKGVILVSVLMLLAFPCLRLISPDNAHLIVKEIRHGVISGYFYDSNPISECLALLSRNF